MSLKLRLGLIVMLPLILMTIVLTWVIQTQGQAFLEEQTNLLQESLRNSRKEALRNYVELAENALKPVLSKTSCNKATDLPEAKRILEGMTFGKTGYFFLYDTQGVNLVHALNRANEGKNLWNYQDINKKWVIRDLLQVSLRPAPEQRFEDYYWEKEAGSRQQAPKLGYVTRLQPCNWMLGTGLYMDDMQLEEAVLAKQVNTNIWHNLRIILFALTLTTLVIFGLMLFVNIHEGRLANQRLQSTAYNFVNLQVKERRRFSHELHDGINQFLVAAKYRIEAGLKQADKGSDKYRQPLQESLGLLDQTITEVRRISHALRPALLDGLGLQQAVDSLISQFVERTHIQVQRDYQLTSTLPDEVEIMAYRVIQEALTNIEKHAQATQVSLQLIERREQLKLLIQDNGQGFLVEESTKAAGIGLTSMRERVELLGGEFRLESRLGKGVSIQAILPLSATHLFD